MNKKILVALMSLLSVVPTNAFAEKIDVTVKGMVCSFCAQGIKKTFSKKENVTNVNVDLDKKLVEIETKKDSSISDDDIRSAITDAGYDVLEIKREKNA